MKYLFMEVMPFFEMMEFVGDPIMLAAVMPALEMSRQATEMLEQVLAREDSTLEERKRALDHAVEMARLLSNSSTTYIDAMMDPGTMDQFATQTVMKWRENVLADLAQERAQLTAQLASIQQTK